MMDMATRRLTRRSLFLLGAGAALGFLRTAASRASPLARVRLATVSSGAVGFLTHVISRRTLDARYSLTLDLVPAEPAAAARMVLLKQVDAGLFPIISAARVINEGQSLSVFGPLLWNHNYGLTYADRPYRRLADLRGKRIATLDAISSTYQSSQLLAATQGLNFANDFQVVTSPAPAVLAFLQRGDVEAIIHFEPNIGNLLSTGKYKVFMDINTEWKRLFGQRMFSVGLAAHDQWINQHFDVARRLVQAVLAGARAIREDPEVFQQYADFLGLDTPAKIKAAQERMPGIYPTEWTRETAEAAELVIRHAVRLGILEKAPVRRVAVVL